jgi:hypothetical protein
MTYTISEYMPETTERTPREISLEIADSLIQARAAIDGACGDYDAESDPEGYVCSILIALMHHCALTGADFNAELERARRSFLTDIMEERTP